MIVPLKEKDGFSFGTLKINKGDIEITNYSKLEYNCDSPDTHLAQIYRRIVRENTHKKIFFDGAVQNTRDFINYFNNEGIELFLVNYKGKEAGFFWLNRFIKKSAFISYCLYKDYWGETSLKICKTCITTLFNIKDKHGDYLLNVLLGVTPENNILALKFLLKIEMVIVGKIPGLIWDAEANKATDAILSYKLRSEHVKRVLPNIF